MQLTRQTGSAPSVCLTISDQEYRKLTKKTDPEINDLERRLLEVLQRFLGDGHGPIKAQLD